MSTTFLERKTFFFRLDTRNSYVCYRTRNPSHIIKNYISSYILIFRYMSYIYCIRMKMDWLISIFIYEGLPNILNRKIFSLACYYRGFVHTLKKWLLFLVKKCCVNTLERNFYWHFSLRCVVGWTIPWCWILWLPFWYYKRTSIL